MLTILRNKISIFGKSSRILIYNFTSSPAIKEKKTVASDEFLSKEQYLKKLTDIREKEEKEEEESKKLHDLYSKMKKREYEVSLSYVDYAKINVENINLIPKENFQSVDELFYFLKNLTGKVSERNISKCLQGLLILSDKLSSKDLENVYYQQFLSILKSNIDLVAEPQNYLTIAKFLDIFCVSDAQIWEKFERKILNKQRGLKISEIIQIFLHFSNQKEGSDHFYDRCEEIFQANFDTMKFEDFFHVFEGYFNSKFGTKEFLLALLTKIQGRINDATPHHLIKLAFICNKAQADLGGLLKTIEAKVIEQVDKLTFDELCNCGVAFGANKANLKIFTILETKIMKDVGEVTPLKIKQILEALGFNYKASKELMLFLKSQILLHIQYFTPIDLAKIVKSYYILEVLEPEDDFFLTLEKKIVAHLKDLKNVKNEELMEFVRCFCVTRNGSREFYKLLELVINYKFKELAKNQDYIEGMYKFYSTSGFCSPELLKQFEVLL